LRTWRESNVTISPLASRRAFSSSIGLDDLVGRAVVDEESIGRVIDEHPQPCVALAQLRIPSRSLAPVADVLHAPERVFCDSSSVSRITEPVPWTVPRQSWGSVD
jgi:hypothetical protein